jgi:3-hydroxyacyl-CoA dehydrogenase / enoyl-CoA hydratase / 3-hydroxybutyryl-CoA epimerase
MGFEYNKDSDGIVTITMDMDGQSANTMNDAYYGLMLQSVERLEAEKGLTGVVFASAKKTFFAGGDLNGLLTADGSDKAFFDQIEQSKGLLRRYEKLPVPVVAAINGAALGGGFEICLACNHRIALNSAAAIVGLPEVTLGLLPGAGGVVRTTALLGLEKALGVVMEGRPLKPANALKLGLIDDIVDQPEDLVPAAKTWIKANPQAAVQPWDQERFQFPGGDMTTARVKGVAVATPAMLYKKTRGNMPAPEKILDIAVYSLRTSIDNALRYETRMFCKLVGSVESKAQIGAFFFDANAIKSGKFRPQGDRSKVARTAVLGAGMMGAGIAYVQAKAGIATSLMDTELANAEKGKSYSETICDRAIKSKRSTPEKKAVLLDQIKPVQGFDFEGLDLIVEAVFEDIALKEQVIAATFPKLSPTGIYGSNTSTLPISILAEACPDPSRFIGIHFFSPVDKMQLVELIVGEMTSDETIRKAYDYVLQIGKTPIVVSDSRGFFTSRVFGTFINEGLELLQDGMAPAAIERAAWLAGMPVGPLQVFDEVTTSLSVLVQETHQELDKRLGVTNGFPVENAATKTIAKAMTDMGRIGRRAGQGFYDYDGDGNRTLWPELEQFKLRDLETSIEDAQDRILYVQAIETLRCLNEGVLRSEAEANLGSIFGIGFPPYTGGAIQFIRGIGIDAFATRAKALGNRYGARFVLDDSAFDILRNTAAKAA